VPGAAGGGGRGRPAWAEPCMIEVLCQYYLHDRTANPLKTEGILRKFKKSGIYNSPKSGRISKIMVPPENLSQYLFMSTNVMGFQ
jgi:hypothetical protein